MLKLGVRRVKISDGNKDEYRRAIKDNKFQVFEFIRKTNKYNNTLRRILWKH